MDIGGVTVLPGQEAQIKLPVADLPSGVPLSILARVRRGRKDGPTLFISAAVHGDEVNGVEILRRVLKKTSLKRLSGTLIAVPVVNVFGFIAQSRYLPDRRDLNRCFPGSETGSLGSRLAHIFINEVVRKSTHGIDLHTGSAQRTNLPQLRVTEDRPKAMDLAKAFGAPVIIQSALREGSLRAAVASEGIPLIVYEGGEANRFDEWAIRAGVRGVLNVMRKLKMLPPPKAPKEKPAKAVKAKPNPVLCSASSWVRSPDSGVFQPKSPLGARVAAGSHIGTIHDSLGVKESQVLASHSGIIVGRSNVALVHEGDALYHIARFGKEKVPPMPLSDFQVDLRQPFLQDGGEQT